MKIIFITISGTAVVLLIAFSASAWFSLSHGHPTAYGTWLHDIVMQDPGEVIVAGFAIVFWFAFWIWIPNSDKSDPNAQWRWWWWDN